MSTESKIRKIQCPKCGASLSLCGGDQVVSLVCSRCQSALDAEHDFAILKTYQSLKRPDVPFNIGMVGTLKGVSFTIIGMVEFTQKDQWGTYPWVEFLLYSPTHGYSWLCYEDRHFVFGREVKDVPTVSFKNLLEIPIFNTTLDVRGKNFKVYECAEADISYVEGELTWVAGVGDKIKYLDAVAPPFLYSVEETRLERENFFGEYVSPEEVFQAFNMPKKPQKPIGVFSCQPYPGSPILTAMARAARCYAVLGLLLVLFSFFSGDTIAEESFWLKAGEKTENFFEIKKSNRLHRLKLKTNLDNADADFDIEIRDDQGALIRDYTEAIDYYHGYDADGRWSEGSRHVSVFFKVPREGNYQWTLSVPASTQPLLQTQVTIDEAVCRPHYYILFVGAMLGFGLYPFFRQRRFERSRWQDYYESQEDDEDEED